MSQEAARPIEIRDDEFEGKVLKSPVPVLIEFWSPSCSFCRKMAPVLDLVAVEYSGRLPVFKMNIQENPVTPPKFEVTGIPAFFLFKDGKVAGKALGAMPKGRLKKELGI